MVQRKERICVLSQMKKGNDFFAHFSEIQTEGFRKLKTGQAVTFRTEEDEQGRGLAKEIYPADSKETKN